MKITAERKYEQLKIKFDSIVHLHLRLLDLSGYQSWIHGESEYFVEYYFSNGNKITTVYGKKDIWVDILKLLDIHLTV